jgi:hypothetical protein
MRRSCAARLGVPGDAETRQECRGFGSSDATGPTGAATETARCLRSVDDRGCTR